MSDPHDLNAPLAQEAFRTRPITSEDKYYAEREQEILEDMKAARAGRSAAERHCPCPECGGNVLDRVMHDNVEIDSCSKCKGIWLDAGELELLSGRAQGSTNGLVRFFRNLAGDYSV